MTALVTVNETYSSASATRIRGKYVCHSKKYSVEDAQFKELGNEGVVIVALYWSMVSGMSDPLSSSNI